MEQFEARSYQLEMLDQSLRQNIIVVMDTGSGKTHVASMRIMAELERCPHDKVVWFLAPTVPLATQQKEAIGAYIPAIKIRLLIGPDGVDRWSDQDTWDAALLDMRIIVSTPAVLANALEHGFVKIEKLALLVFDEAHNCVKNDPGNRIMRDFYHPARIRSAEVPHILGLTASPIMRSNVGDISVITSTNVKSLGMLHQVRSGAMLVGDFRSQPEDPLRRFCAKADSVYVTLGAWAADYFVVESSRRLVNRMAIDSEGLWADAGKLRLGEMLRVISTRERLHFSDQDAVSAKVGCLLSFLEEQHHNAFSGIVFVKERAIAYALATVIAHHPVTRDLFRCQACVDPADVHNTLRQFRDGRLNLVIATNVLEEGIDMTACNVVVCFDQPSNIKSFIQRRGRARQEKSTFAIMVSSDCESKTISQWRDLEEEMIRLYQDQERMIQDLEALEMHPEPVPFRLRLPTGALLTAESAIPHLHHFCCTLRAEPHVDTRPMYKVERQCGMSRASVILPSSIDPSLRLRQGVSWWLTDRAAKRDAAFQAYVSLHRAKLINDHLLPSSQDRFRAPDEADYGQTSSRIALRERYNPWQTMPGFSSQLGVYRHRISIKENMTSRPDLSLVLITYGEIPAAKPLTLYWDSRTTFVVSLESSEHSTVSKGHLELLRKTTRFFLYSARTRSPHNEDIADYALLVSPNISFDDLAEWLDMNQGSRNCLDQYADDPSVIPPGFVRCESLHGLPHLFVRWVQPTEGSELQLRCRPFPRRKNLLHRGGLPSKEPQAQVPLDENEVAGGKVVPARLSRSDSLPWEISRTSLFLPPLTHHIQRLLMAESLRDTLLRPSHPMNLETIADAITCPSSQWPSNYQRLEYLGDSTLKFAVCIQLYHEHPLWHEGYLSQVKNSIVSNGSLTQAALRARLDSFLLYIPFATRRWIAPKLRVDDSSTIEIELSSKVLADVLEALIGASFVDGGYPSAWSTIHRFLEQIPNSMPSLSGRQTPGTSLAIPHELDEKIDILMTQIKAAMVNGSFLAFLCLDLGLNEDTVQICESHTGKFDHVLQRGRLELWRFMRHDSPDIPTAQQSCANRVLKEQVRVEHPRAILSKMIGSSSVDYYITRNVEDTSLHDVTVTVNGEALAYVYGCLSKDECIVRGAELAVVKLGSTPE
ncbi:Dicer-like protein 2 [Aspergillus hancockii]|nr:Dicer-like protein 2 [Aspergillus hancockii]